MKKIELSGKHGIGKFALVDDEDFVELNMHTWGVDKAGYPTRSVHLGTFDGKKKHKAEYLHRKISKPQKMQVVDHINGNKLDNRKQNLRNCSQSQNRMNSKKVLKTIIDGKFHSIYKGAFYSKEAWQCGLRLNKKSIYIGRFKEERHAAMAYDLWAKDLFGEFAKLNF